MIDKIFFIVLTVTAIGIPLHFSIFPLCVAALVLRCCTCERTTVAAFMMLYAGPTIGCIRSIYPSLPIYGLIFWFFGLILVGPELRVFFRNSKNGLVFLLLVFAGFFLSFLYGGQHLAGEGKLQGIVVNGITSFIGYYILFNSKSINNEQFTQMLIFTSLIMIEYFVTGYGLSPSGFFDFNWLRQGWLFNEKNLEHSLINYQHVGMNTAFAYGMLLAKKKITQGKLCCYSLICLYLSLMSGARQAFLAIVVILILRLILLEHDSEKKYRMLYICGPVMILLFSYYIAIYFNVDVIISTFQEGDAGRALLRTQALDIFCKKPYLGCGLGGFSVITGEVYPHNFFLELLCECGLLGTLYFGVIVLIFVIKNNIGVKCVTCNDSYFIIVMTALVVRCMVSGDFTLSIQLFSALFTLGKIK